MIARTNPRLAFTGALVAAALMLLWPVAINRDAVWFSDTVNYLSAGRKFWAVVLPKSLAPTIVQGTAAARKAAAASIAGAPPTQKSAIGGRSPFYGVVAWAAFAAAGARGVAVVQALWVGAALLLALGTFGIAQLRWRLAAVAGLAVSSTVAAFTCFVMPDVFAALGPLALGLLWFAGNRMHLPERVFWAATLLAATVFHTSVLVVVGVLAVGLALSARRAVRRREAGTIAGVLATASVATVATVALASMIGHTRVTTPPFLLARVIGDGTAAPVLASECPTRHWQTCRYLPAMPMTENEFLWDSTRAPYWVGLPPDLRAAVAAEQGPILRAVLVQSPLTQLGRSLHNVVAQLGTVSLHEFEYHHIVDMTLSASDFAPARARFDASAISRNRLSLTPLANLWGAVAALSAVAIVGALLFRRRLGIGPVTAGIAATLLAAIVVNAAVNGVVSGVFGRYGAREAWLALLAVIALAAARRRAAVPATAPAHATAEPAIA